jgi:hypothetical protein
MCPAIRLSRFAGFTPRDVRDTVPARLAGVSIGMAFAAECKEFSRPCGALNEAFVSCSDPFVRPESVFCGWLPGEST